MTENQWKASLVKRFKATHKRGFVWSFEARFKAGFPDLMFAEKGYSIYFELKKLKRLPPVAAEAIEPIQLEVMKQMRIAGLYTWGIVRSGNRVSVLHPITQKSTEISVEDFHQMIELPIEKWGVWGFRI